jgi:hypothetical protein
VEIAPVSSNFAAIAPRLGPLIRLLSSDQDGEVVAAGRAIVRTLKTADFDIHTLAGLVETPAEPIDERLQEAFDAGLRAGIAIGERRSSERRSSPAVPYSSMAIFCQRRARRLSVKEANFIGQMARIRGAPSSKQARWLADIYERLRGAA